MALRPTDGDENRRIGAGSVSALAWFFNGAVRARCPLQSRAWADADAFAITSKLIESFRFET